MQVRMSVVDPSAHPAAPVDVVVDGPTGVTWQQVEPAVAQALAEAGHRLGAEATFRVGARPVAPKDLLGEDPLVRGALLVIDDGPPLPPDPRGGGLLEVHVVGGPGAGLVVRLSRGTHVIGRAAGCAVRLDDPGVSRAHATLTVSDSGIQLRPLLPTNGSTVDGQPLPAGGAALSPGTHVRLASTTLLVRRMPPASARRAARHGRVLLHRPPRVRQSRPRGEIRFPDPPPLTPWPRLTLLPALVSLVLSAALALTLQTPTMLLFALLSPVLVLGQWASDRRHGRRDHGRKAAAHDRETAEAQARLDDALTAEAVARAHEHPDLAEVGALARDRDQRLWCRRPGDDDYLTVRIGTARQPALVRVSGQTAPASSVEAPALASLTDLGVLGVAGPRGAVVALAGAMVAQLAAWQSPRDVRIAVLTGCRTAESDWRWATWLPHWLGPPVPRAAWTGHAPSPPAEARAQAAGLLGMAAARRGPQASTDRSSRHTDLVVVIDGVQALRRLPEVALLLQQGTDGDVLLLCLDTEIGRLPPETRGYVSLDPANGSAASLATSGGTLAAITADLPTAGWLEALGRALAPLEDATPEPHTARLPDQVCFRALHRADDVAPCDPGVASSLAARWSAGTGRLRALLGTSSSGPYAVDLVADGPHLLVGGTTGAGKSELLRTLVASLAVSAPPHQLSFVLVDYKGGSAFRDCARLPHTVGLVTDLDEHLTRRALASLDAEIRRRERLLASVGAESLREYERRGRVDSTPLARMVIVVDEFRLLADDLPDFVAGLVRIAAVGRSLGVHLVLATQRPAGIVTGDMRANVQLRVALRMRDAGDSRDVLDGPEAASISDRLPGRGYVRGASDRLVEIQSAQVSAASPPADHGERLAVRVIERVTATRPGAPSEPTRGREPPLEPETESDLTALVRAAGEVAAAAGHRGAPPPWLPPLPQCVPLADLWARPASAPAPTPSTLIPLGLVDRPSQQRQDEEAWDLATDGHLGIAGGARTGRTSAVLTLALGIAQRCSPEQAHLHLLEGCPGALAVLEGLPHVGSVTGTADPAHARRAVDRLTRQLDDPPVPSPRFTVVLVDGWEALQEAFDRLDHGGTTERLLRLLRDGLAGGIRFVVTGGRALTGGRLVPLVQRRLVLALPDPLDLALVGLDRFAAPNPWPPGRAVDPATGLQLQIGYVPSSEDGEPAGDRGLSGAETSAGSSVSTPPAATSERRTRGDSATSIVAASRARWSQVPPASLPWTLTPLPRRVLLRDLPSGPPPLLTIGCGEEPTALGFDPAAGQRRVLVAGTRRSGRSTALDALAARLVEQHLPVIVVAPRSSGPRTDRRDLDVHRLGAGDAARFVELRRATPHVAILVDDADILDGTPMAGALAEAATLVQAAGGVMAVAVEVARRPVAFRGVVAEIARDATGLLLCPTSPADGDLFGLRAEPVATRVPGRGWHIIDGEATPIQVADPT